MDSGHLTERQKRRAIRELDVRYVVPADLDPIRVLSVLTVPNNDGGTGSHNVYVCLCDEVEPDG